MASVVTCGKCGAPGRPGALFCAACGGELTQSPGTGRTGTVIAATPDLSSPPAVEESPPEAHGGASGPAVPTAQPAVSPASNQGQPTRNASADEGSGSSAPVAPVETGRIHWSAIATIASLGASILGVLLVLIGSVLAEQVIDDAMRAERIGITDADVDLVATAERADLVYGAGWLTVFVALVLGAIFFIVWLYGAYGRVALDGFDKDAMRRPRHQTIWAWAVPIFGLFRPVQLVADCYRASCGPLTETESTPWKRPIGATIVIWWILWLVGGFVGNSAARVVDGADAASFADSEGLYYVESALLLPWGAAAIAAILVVLKIARQPVQRVSRRASS